MEDKNGKELMESLLNRIADRIASRVPVTVEDNMSTRTASLTAILETQHMMTQTEQVDCGIRINVFNCHFRSIVIEQHSIFTFHSHLKSSFIWTKVSLKKCLAWGDLSCCHMAHNTGASSQSAPAA